MQQPFYLLVYTKLLASCPVDSTNMITNITYEDYGTYQKIIVSGPTDRGYDYASIVNAKKTPNISGPNKGRVNYQWVERAVNSAAKQKDSDSKYELP
jgi:hypothetical protein